MTTARLYVFMETIPQMHFPKLIERDVFAIDLVLGIVCVFLVNCSVLKNSCLKLQMFQSRILIVSIIVIFSTIIIIIANTLLYSYTSFGKLNIMCCVD